MTSPMPAAVRNALVERMRRRRLLPAEDGARIMVEQLGSARGALAYLAGMGDWTNERPWWLEVRRLLEEQLSREGRPGPRP